VLAATDRLHTVMSKSGIMSYGNSMSQGCIQMDVRDVRQDALLANERKVNCKTVNTYFLEGSGILSRCLGFHPIPKRPPILRVIDKVASILDGDWAILSRLTHLTLSCP